MTGKTVLTVYSIKVINFVVYLVAMHTRGEGYGDYESFLFWRSFTGEMFLIAIPVSFLAALCNLLLVKRGKPEPRSTLNPQV
jgi:hypothetical protein